jgi:uncharacterized membrane protein YebE (DUF533 family)
MKRLTIGVDACTEILALLVAIAWADGELKDEEKEGVRGAAVVLNLPKELRDRLEAMLEKKTDLESVLFETLSARDGAFAFVAASWMTMIDEKVDPAEEKMISELAAKLSLSEEQRNELAVIAKGLVAEKKAKNKFRWADDVMSLFKAIPAKIYQEADVEVSFE